MIKNLGSRGAPTQEPCTLIQQRLSVFGKQPAQSSCIGSAEELSRQDLSENQPEQARKAAGVRQHLSKASWSTF